MNPIGQLTPQSSALDHHGSEALGFLKAKSLDLGVRLLENGQWVVKQFGSSAAAESACM